MSNLIQKNMYRNDLNKTIAKITLNFRFGAFYCYHHYFYLNFMKRYYWSLDGETIKANFFYLLTA